MRTSFSALANIKHHWFWKLNWLKKNVQFERVLLLEEDYALVPDILNTLELLSKEKHDFVSLGNYVNNLNLTAHFTKLPNSSYTYDHSYFSSSENNMGLTFSFDFVEKILSLGVDFCLYDDYNWDFSLMHLSTEVSKSHWLVISPLLSRVQHLGVKTCGTHITDKKATECKVDEIRQKFQEDMRSQNITNSLFPSKMVETSKPKKLFAKKPYRSGGWGDPRDIKLCLSFIEGETNLEALRSMT